MGPCCKIDIKHYNDWTGRKCEDVRKSGKRLENMDFADIVLMEEDAA